MARQNGAVIKTQYTTQTPARWRAIQAKRPHGSYREHRKDLADSLRKIRKDPLSRKALRREVKSYKA